VAIQLKKPVGDGISTPLSAVAPLVNHLITDKPKFRMNLGESGGVNQKSKTNVS